MRGFKMTDKFEINLNSVDKTIVGKINTQLDNYDKGITGSNKSVNLLATIIHDSNMIDVSMISKYSSITQSDVRPFVDACITQILGVEDVKSFNKNKRDGLNQSMIIALATIKKDALFKNSKGQSISNGNLLIKDSIEGIDHNKGTGDSTPISKKDALSWAKEVLHFVKKNDTHKSPIHKKGTAFFDALGNSEEYTGIWKNFDKTQKIDIGTMTTADIKRWYNNLGEVLKQLNVQTQTPKQKIYTDVKLKEAV
jgi:hypothetical protein